MVVTAGAGEVGGAFGLQQPFISLGIVDEQSDNATGPYLS